MKRIWERNNQLIPLKNVEAYMAASAVHLSGYLFRIERRQDEKFRKDFLCIMKESNGGHLECAFCGHRGLSMQRATIDHFIPVSKGGKRRDMTNLVVACEECNKHKGNLDGEELVKWIEEQMKIRRKRTLQWKAKNIRRKQRKVAQQQSKEINNECICKMVS